jgi:hypothetical protein
MVRQKLLRFRRVDCVGQGGFSRRDCLPYAVTKS